MRRLLAATARIRAAAAAAARWRPVSYTERKCGRPPVTLGPLLPYTPPPPPRRLGPWRPRIRPELRTIRERVIIFYTLADVLVAAVLAVSGWPVEGAW
jgi:hypothetical protein